MKKLAMIAVAVAVLTACGSTSGRTARASAGASVGASACHPDLQSGRAYYGSGTVPALVTSKLALCQVGTATLGPVTGAETFYRAVAEEHIYDWLTISPPVPAWAFSQYELKGPGKPSGAVSIAIYEMFQHEKVCGTCEARYPQIFEAIGDPENLRIAQEQAVRFAIERRHEYRSGLGEWGTAFLFTRADEPVSSDRSNIFVAVVSEYKGHLILGISPYAIDFWLDPNYHASRILVRQVAAQPVSSSSDASVLCCVADAPPARSQELPVLPLQAPAPCRTRAVAGIGVGLRDADTARRACEEAKAMQAKKEQPQ
jgi:hypothetical protein